MKLFGIFDVKTDTLIKKLEPYDYEYCFTLTFETDYVADAYGISYGVDKLDLLNLTGIPEFGIPLVLYTQIYEKDGNYYGVSDFLNAVRYAHTYKIDNNELKLYSNVLAYRWNT